MSGYKDGSAANAKAGSRKFEHYCDSYDCQKWGTYGYKTAREQFWFCLEHKQEGEDLLAGRRE